MYIPSICLEAQRKTRVIAVRIVGALPTIRAWHGPSTSLMHHDPASLRGKYINFRNAKEHVIQN
jgi:hypothetical protein